jgi:hypothetical protein
MLLNIYTLQNRAEIPEQPNKRQPKNFNTKAREGGIKLGNLVLRVPVRRPYAWRLPLKTRIWAITIKKQPPSQIEGSQSKKKD